QLPPPPAAPSGAPSVSACGSTTPPPASSVATSPRPPDPILFRQMFCCQRRSKPFSFRSRILLPDQPQHLPPEFLGLRPIRTSACAAMLQPFGSFFPIALPQPLRLPIAHLQHLRCVYQPQRPALHSP